MANYYATARSNYFAVKDEEAFMAWAATVPDVSVVTRQTDGNKLFALLVDDGDYGGWPSFRYDEDTDEESEICILGELADHLAPGHVAVLMEAGAEKLRYVTGWAGAVNDQGEMIQLCLSDIMDMVRDKWPGSEVTDCSY